MIRIKNNFKLQFGYKKLNQEPLVQTIQKRKFKFTDFEEELDLYIPKPIQGKKRQRRLKLMNSDLIARLIELTEVRVDSLRNSAKKGMNLRFFMPYIFMLFLTE